MLMFFDQYKTGDPIKCYQVIREFGQISLRNISYNRFSLCQHKAFPDYQLRKVLSGTITDFTGFKLRYRNELFRGDFCSNVFSMKDTLYLNNAIKNKDSFNFICGNTEFKLKVGKITNYGYPVIYNHFTFNVSYCKGSIVKIKVKGTHPKPLRQGISFNFTTQVIWKKEKPQFRPLNRFSIVEKVRIANSSILIVFGLIYLFKSLKLMRYDQHCFSIVIKSRNHLVLISMFLSFGIQFLFILISLVFIPYFKRVCFITVFNAFIYTSFIYGISCVYLENSFGYYGLEILLLDTFLIWATLSFLHSSYIFCWTLYVNPKIYAVIYAIYILYVIFANIAGKIVDLFSDYERSVSPFVFRTNLIPAMPQSSIETQIYSFLIGFMIYLLISPDMLIGFNKIFSDETYLIDGMTVLSLVSGIIVIISLATFFSKCIQEDSEVTTIGQLIFIPLTSSIYAMIYLIYFVVTNGFYTMNNIGHMLDSCLLIIILTLAATSLFDYVVFILSYMTSQQKLD